MELELSGGTVDVSPTGDGGVAFTSMHGALVLRDRDEVSRVIAALGVALQESEDVLRADPAKVVQLNDAQ
jgi:hypothetical protein